MAVTGIDELFSAELEIKKGVIFNSSGCCATGTVSISFLPADVVQSISDELDALDIDALAAELSVFA